ncbi:MAG: hypothetical protein MR868_06385 [Lachnospiraceae bacterium]|nr:hypothetical protein [Lachnospiraceae bacterium]
MKKKRFVVSLLAAGLSLSCISPAFAQGFTGELGNEATFETLLEAHTNAPAVVQGIVENGSKTFVGHPALEAYPDGTTFVYRSANQYAGRAAARLNTNLIVAAEQHFADKDEAFAYLKELGVIDLIDEATGSVILITPEGETFGQADVKDYYSLQTAMLAQKDGGTDAEGNAVFYADAEYFGGYGYVYYIGIGGGASFFHNFLSVEKDFAGRIAGALLIDGQMQRIRKPEIMVPVYLVNNSEDVIDKYKEINTTNASATDDEKTVYYNQAFPLRKVIVSKQNAPDLAETIKDAYYGMFIKAMRVPLLPQAMNSGGTEYAGYNFDEAPYSLCERNTLINGKTADGICLIEHQMDDDRFAEIKTQNDVTNFDGSVTPAGEYIDVWYEYLPQEVLDGTALDGSVPLILANHGGGDDARVFVEENGFLNLAGRERLAVVAPDHQLIGEIRGEALTAIVKYMLEKYPALDASRVYATGYSMGGGATYTVGYYEPSLFAAIAPCAGSPTAIPEDQISNFDDCGLPAILTLTSFDSLRRLEALEGNINEPEQQMLTLWTSLNGIELPAYDFETYPYLGIKGDKYVVDMVNDEFENDTWYLNDEAGNPRVAFAFLQGPIHALYPEYANIVWDFMKHYSRNTETGETIYNPYIN